MACPGPSQAAWEAPRACPVGGPEASSRGPHTHLLTCLWYPTSLATWLWSNGFYPAVLFLCFYFGTKFLEVMDHLCASALKPRERALLAVPAAKSSFLGLVKNAWTEAQMRGLRYQCVHVAATCSVFQRVSILSAP